MLYQNILVLCTVSYLRQGGRHTIAYYSDLTPIMSTYYMGRSLQFKLSLMRVTTSLFNVTNILILSRVINHVNISLVMEFAIFLIPSRGSLNKLIKTIIGIQKIWAQFLSYSLRNIPHTPIQFFMFINHFVRDPLLNFVQWYFRILIWFIDPVFLVHRKLLLPNRLQINIGLET